MSQQQEKTYESYGWTIDWTCPECGHKHSKPHFSFKGQIDKKIKPNMVGRIKDKFNREGKDGENLTCEEYIKKNGTGDEKDKDGNQKPLFCYHCGWEDLLIYINKVNKDNEN